jgi:hypothetical protein
MISFLITYTSPALGKSNLSNLNDFLEPITFRDVRCFHQFTPLDSIQYVFSRMNQKSTVIRRIRNKMMHSLNGNIYENFIFAILQNTIFDNSGPKPFGDLYKLPREILAKIIRYITDDKIGYKYFLAIILNANSTNLLLNFDYRSFNEFTRPFRFSIDDFTDEEFRSFSKSDYNSLVVINPNKTLKILKLKFFEQMSCTKTYSHRNIYVGSLSDYDRFITQNKKSLAYLTYPKPKKMEPKIIDAWFQFGHSLKDGQLTTVDKKWHLLEIGLDNNDPNKDIFYYIYHASDYHDVRIAQTKMSPWEIRCSRKEVQLDSIRCEKNQILTMTGCFGHLIPPKQWSNSCDMFSYEQLRNLFDKNKPKIFINWYALSRFTFLEDKYLDFFQARMDSYTGNSLIGKMEFAFLDIKKLSKRHVFYKYLSYNLQTNYGTQPYYNAILKYYHELIGEKYIWKTSHLRVRAIKTLANATPEEIKNTPLKKWPVEHQLVNDSKSQRINLEMKVYHTKIERHFNIDGIPISVPEHKALWDDIIKMDTDMRVVLDKDKTEIVTVTKTLLSEGVVTPKPKFSLLKSGLDVYCKRLYKAKLKNRCQEIIDDELNSVNLCLLRHPKMRLSVEQKHVLDTVINDDFKPKKVYHESIGKRDVYPPNHAEELKKQLLLIRMEFNRRYREYQRWWAQFKHLKAIYPQTAINLNHQTRLKKGEIIPLDQSVKDRVGEFREISLRVVTKDVSRDKALFFRLGYVVNRRLRDTIKISRSTCEQIAVQTQIFLPRFSSKIFPPIVQKNNFLVGKVENHLQVFLIGSLFCQFHFNMVIARSPLSKAKKSLCLRAYRLMMDIFNANDQSKGEEQARALSNHSELLKLFQEISKKVDLVLLARSCRSNYRHSLHDPP